MGTNKIKSLIDTLSKYASESGWLIALCVTHCNFLSKALFPTIPLYAPEGPAILEHRIKFFILQAERMFEFLLLSSVIVDIYYMVFHLVITQLKKLDMITILQSGYTCSKMANPNPKAFLQTEME